MDQVKFPEWTPSDLVRAYKQVLESHGDEDFLECIYRLGSDKSMKDLWTWLLENQKKDAPKNDEELAQEPLVVAICTAIGWGISLAKNAETENPIPLNESNKKLKAIIKKTQSLIDDIKGNYQATKTSRLIIRRLVEKKAGIRLGNLGLNENAFSGFDWRRSFSQLIEAKKDSLPSEKIQKLSAEDRALFIAQESIHLGFDETLEYLCEELENSIKRAGKMSKSARVYMLPYLNRVFELYFDEVPKEKFCELVSVVEFDKIKGFNPLTWDDIKPYLSRK